MARLIRLLARLVLIWSRLTFHQQAMARNVLDLIDTGRPIDEDASEAFVQRLEAIVGADLYEGERFR